MSVMMDHYRSRKRRHCLSSKTPPSESKDSMNSSQETSELEDQVSDLKGIPRPKKKQRKMSPSLVRSSDESTFEIHWDNNSPNPSQASRKRKSSRRNVKNNISTLLKHVPKKRTSGTSNEEERESLLTTWMLENLASSTVNNEQSLQKPVTRSSSAKRTSSSKGEALNFNEEIKKFLEQVKAPETGSGNEKSSSPFSAMTSTRRNTSPNYFSNSETDSLYNFDISNDSMLSDFDTMSLRKTPMRACRVVVKTPKLQKISKSTAPLISDSVRKHETPVHAAKKYDSVETSSKDNKTPVRAKLRLPRRKSTRSSLKPISECAVNKPCANILQGNQQKTSNCHVIKNLEIDFEDDGLDEILSTQAEIFLHSKQVACVSNAPPEVDDSRKMQRMPDNFTLTAPKCDLSRKANCDKITLETAAAMSTTNKKKGDEGIVKIDDDDKVFDDILANIDIDFKFKSQETPLRLTSDQRKLKARCHTSPLPLNTHTNRRLEKYTNHTGTSTNMKDMFSSKTGKARLTKVKCAKSVVVSEVDQSDYMNVSFSIPVIKNITDSQRSYISPVIATTACRKPFIPPKKNDDESQNYSMISKRSTSNHFSEKLVLPTLQVISKLPTIDVSAIERSTPYVIDVNLGNSLIGVSENQEHMSYCSTQKCTMTEIEQKRKFAQSRLRQRLRKKVN